MLRRFLASRFAVSEQHVPVLETLLLLFLCWGFLLSLNDLLTVAIRFQLHLSYRAALLLPSGYFLVTFLSTPFVGDFLERYGYRWGLFSGLAVVASGAVLMAFCISLVNWPGCITAGALMGLGINLLQTAAAPWITHLGNAEDGARRFAFALAFNSLGAAAGPHLARHWFRTDTATAPPPSIIATTYLGLAGAILLVLLLVHRMPKMHLPEEIAAKQQESRTRWRDLLRHPRLIFGAACTFLYVGAEISLGSLLVPFDREAHIGIGAATRMLSAYWGGAMLGRFLLVPLLRRPRDLTVLLTASGIAAVLMAIASIGKTHASAFALLPMGLCNAVILPVLWDRSVQNLGGLIPRGAAVMSAMGVGGTFFPQVMAWISDRSSVHSALLWLTVPYMAIAIYAMASRMREPHTHLA